MPSESVDESESRTYSLEVTIDISIHLEAKQEPQIVRWCNLMAMQISEDHEEATGCIVSDTVFGDCDGSRRRQVELPVHLVSAIIWWVWLW